MSYLIDHQIHCSNQFIERLLGNSDLPALLECAAELTCTELQASATVFWYLNRLNQSTTVAHPLQHSWDIQEFGRLLPQSTTDQSVLISGSDPQIGVMLTQLGFRVALIIPVRSQMPTIHSLFVAWKAMPPHEIDLAHANLVGRYLGLALANAERHIEAEQHSNVALQQVRLSERLAGMSRLTTVIAHEVNNPLQAIVNTLQLLGRPLEPAKHERYLLMATEEAERLARTIQRALAFYQPTREGRRAVGLHSLLERVIEQMQPLCVGHQIVIERDFSAENLHVIGVVSHVREVFLSLLHNAIDARVGQICSGAQQHAPTGF